MPANGGRAKVLRFARVRFHGTFAFAQQDAGLNLVAGALGSARQSQRSASRGLTAKRWVELGCQLVAQFAHFVGVKSPAQKFTALDQLGEVTEKTAEQTSRIRLGGPGDTDQLGTALRTEDRGNAHRGGRYRASH